MLLVKYKIVLDSLALKWKSLRNAFLPIWRFKGVIRWLALPEFSSSLASACPCLKFECKCGTELFLTLVNNSNTLSQKVLTLYPQIHQSRLMGDPPADCVKLWNADSLQRCPEFFLFKFPTRSQEFCQWQVSKTAPEASPSAWTLQSVLGCSVLLLCCACCCLFPSAWYLLLSQDIFSVVSSCFW